MPQILHSIKEVRKVPKKRGFSYVVLITSKKVSKRLSWAISEIRESFNQPLKILYIPDGEAAKELAVVEKVLAELLKMNADRNTLIVALGGGSVGDTVGFVASIYKRGVRYVQIPTTLLSQVDSAHGGKTGINFLGYKNQIGTTYEPEAIVIDSRMLKTLSEAQIIDGLGEVIKSGFIKDVSIVRLLQKETISTIKNSKNLPKIIERTIRVKNFYTTQDPLEKNVRKILNVGHTIGHAVELQHGISHGKAVIMGMIEELELTEKLGMTERGTLHKLQDLLAKLGIKIDPKITYDSKSIKKDKKVVGQKIELPIVRKVGVGDIVMVDVDIFTCK